MMKKVLYYDPEYTRDLLLDSMLTSVLFLVCWVIPDFLEVDAGFMAGILTVSGARLFFSALFLYLDFSKKIKERDRELEIDKMRAYLGWEVEEEEEK